MTSFAVGHPFEYAPHAARSVAMALTLSLNLAILLFALLPSTPYPIHAPLPQSLLAAVLQPPPPVAPPPALPTLRVAHRITTPGVRVPATHPVPMALPALPAIAPVALLQNTVPASGSNTPGVTRDSDATIAYEAATPPAYPIQALRSGIQGTVLLKVLVDTTGMPIQVVIEHGSGSRLLDDAARKHVLARWRFHPSMREGHAIEAWALVPVRFDLNRD